MDIEKVLEISKGLPDEERLGMILGNRIDYGSEAGGLISVKQLPQLAKDLIVWRDSSR